MIAPRPVATFGAGCFWSVESAFRRLPGVLRTSVGFMGGCTEAPTYGLVCIGNTGHAEVVQMVYDPDLITYEQLLSCFWKCHDPTSGVKAELATENQYRSVIFYHSDDQLYAADSSKAAEQVNHKATIPTQIHPAGTYTLADSSHQHYEEKHAFLNASQTR